MSWSPVFHHQLGRCAREQSRRVILDSRLQPRAGQITAEKLHCVRTREDSILARDIVCRSLFTRVTFSRCHRGTSVCHRVWSVEINGSFQALTRHKKWIGSCENEILGFFLCVCMGGVSYFSVVRIYFQIASLFLRSKRFRWKRACKHVWIEKKNVSNDIFVSNRERTVSRISSNLSKCAFKCSRHAFPLFIALV